MKKRFKSISFSQCKTRLKRLFNKATWQDLKERYHRWRLNPFKYEEAKAEAHHCNCCYLDFEGGFCPRCGQRGNAGRIGWNSVREGVMDIWGLGNRSLLYSLWQLVFRPGYFVGDYISGKRQVSFPPVKMLFIMTILYAIIVEWFFPDVMGIVLDESAKKIVHENSDNIVDAFVVFLKEHRAWGMLFVSSFLIVPVWVFFRYAPRQTKHTLPEGFFISVFVCLLISLYNLMVPLTNFVIGKLADVILFPSLVIIIFMLYKQLFGYSLWGTLWRLGGVVFCAFLIAVTAFMVFMVTYAKMGKVKELDTGEYNVVIKASLFFFVFILLNFAVAHLINIYSRRKSRRREAALKQTKDKAVAEYLAQTEQSTPNEE